jgi:AraC-like DNA-binding protein
MSLLKFLLPFILIPIFFILIYKTPYALFPSMHNTNIISAYSDSIEQGTSQIDSFHINDTSASVSFTLHKGFPYPYAGLNIKPPKGAFPDFSQYDFIDLDLYTEQTKAVQFFLNTYEPGYTKENIPLSFRHVLYELPVKHQSGVQRIWLKDFKTPIWWYPLVGVREKDLGEPHMDKVMKLSFSNGVLLPLDTKDRITIRSITLGKSYISFLLYALTSSIIYYIFLAGLIYIRKKRAISKPTIIPYQQIEWNETDDEILNKAIIYLSANYIDPELSLSSISQELGISSRTISAEIKKHFNVSFKQYINNIRLNESRRLLKETNLPVNEIAYKVGFSNVTHFNRSFRQQSNCSPLEYRSE